MVKYIDSNGLCYSELVTLRKLWKKANNSQKNCIIVQNIQNKPKSSIPQEVASDGAFTVQKERISNKLEEITPKN